MNAVIVLTTVGAAFDVAALARTLVDEHLAACVNVLPPMQSIYRWQGQVHVDDERQLVIKTSSDRLDALQLRLARAASLRRARVSGDRCRRRQSGLPRLAGLGDDAL